MAGEVTVLDCIVENINTINAATTEIASLVAGASDEERDSIVKTLDLVRALAAPAIGQQGAPDTSPELDLVMTRFSGVLQALAPHDREGSDVVRALALFGARVAWECWLCTNESGGFVSAPGGMLNKTAISTGLMLDDDDLSPRPHVSAMVSHLWWGLKP